MLSDGRILRCSLAKATCLTCGAASHTAPPTEDTTLSHYGEDYALAKTAPLSDTTRAENYGRLVTRLLEPPSRAMEIGCGSGRLLRVLGDAWPTANLLGIDPALPPGLPHEGRVHYGRSHFSAHATESHGHDLILSINVIEHVLAPVDFLRDAARRLSPNGKILLTCPSASPPNVEMLFLDHLFTYSPNTMALIAELAGLSVIAHGDHPPEAANFQYFVLANTATTHGNPMISREATPTLPQDQAAYLAQWQGLDAALLGRVSGDTPLFLFGAGEMAALLRCYTPRVWERTTALVLDNPAEAWNLDRPAIAYSPASLPAGATVIIATAPASQAGLSRRLITDGLCPVRFDDLIPN